VIVAGSGRCGSTLLQSILNTNPDFLIWGEHNGFLRQIAASYYEASVPHALFPDASELSAGRRIKRLRNPRHWPAWDNLCGQAELRDRFRDFVRSLFADPAGNASRWGFKEIRYGRDERDQTLRLMFDCFSDAKLIVLAREPEDTIFSALSHWNFAKQREGNVPVEQVEAEILATAKAWDMQYRLLLAFSKAHAPNCLALRYEDLACADTYQTLRRFLNSGPFDFEKHIGRVKDASNKTDPTAALIRCRIQLLRPQIAAMTGEMRAAYGYSRDPSGIAH
jgi:hypothetical protein